MYMIDPKIAQLKGLQRYGFHGLSYSYILKRVASYLKKVDLVQNVGLIEACGGNVHNNATPGIGSIRLRH